MLSNERIKKYRLENPDKIKAITKRYYDNHKEQLTEYNKHYAKKKYQTDEEYRKYMNQKALDRYYANRNPYVVESKRLLRILI